MKRCGRCGLRYPDANDRCFVDGASLESVPDERIGKLLRGRYLIEAQLGEGGMATVYRARHTLVDRPMAVKVMNPTLVGDAALRERFRREARNAAALAHPNIVEIYDFGEEDGLVFLVMELLEGSSLAALIESGPMPSARVASIGVQIARGLARAHDLGVIHRDLKPDNVFVVRPGTNDEIVKILDFGIARSVHDSRLTTAGQIFGTPQYMAPERVTSIDAGPPADLYALGVILFEMLTGRPPFEASDVTGFLLAHLQQPPPRPSSLVPDCPRRLDELVLRLLAKKPEERPVDAHAVVRELEAILPHDSGRVSLPPPAASGAMRSIAPTLPPTTLERWAGRLALFEQMLQRAFMGRPPPPELSARLDEVRGILERLHALRTAGLREQRRLETLEAQARESRERLGHAVHVLGVDLSAAREAARAARTQVQPYFEATRQAEERYRAAVGGLGVAGAALSVPEPTETLVATLREAAEAADRWLLARNTARQAEAWVASKEAEVRDLEYQVATLRAALERSEAEQEATRAQVEAVLAEQGEQTARLEAELISAAVAYCEPLRGRRELGDLFARLEVEGGS
ncbi:MAG: protein kinase [Myxococcota bacterium]|nr:protein kinase [Myxococcota bacterium]